MGHESPNWQVFRDQMPVARKWAYFDHAAVAPLPTPTSVAMQEWLQQATDEGDTVWPEWAARVERTRATAATLINAHAHEIALIPNTTAGLSIVSEGLAWNEGDHVVTLDNEFPSNQYPWLHLASRGVRATRVHVDDGIVDLNRIADAMTDRTKVLAISWVGYASGWRIDVDDVVRMAHDRGVYVMLDAIQGLGVFPLDVKKSQVDFVAADGHKWMLGPEGAGFFYVRHDLLDQLRPTAVGWHSVTSAGDFHKIELTLRPDAARFECGSQNLAGFIGLGASLELLISHGLGPSSSPVADRVLQITDIACERLHERGATICSSRVRQHASGIVSFEIPGKDPVELRRRCLARGVALSCRAGRLRITPHAYVNESDVDRLVESLWM